MTTAEARTYLEDLGTEIREVTIKRHLKRGWNWYAPAVGQMLTDAELVQYATNTRENVSLSGFLGTAYPSQETQDN